MQTEEKKPGPVKPRPPEKTGDPMGLFREIPELGYEEAARSCNAKAFVDIIESRRSVRVFLPEPIPPEVTRQCLELALLAPSSSNMQPWEFLWARSPAKKAALVEACLSQPGARTAQELIVCVAHRNAWKKHAPEMLETFDRGEKETGLKVPLSARLYYRKIVPLAYGQGFLSIVGAVKRAVFFFKGLFEPIPREPVSKADMRVWAVKSVSLACENLMLAFSAYGYDTCPMEGYDSSRLRKIFDLPGDSEVVMVISAGKRAPNGVYGPRIRFDSNRFIREV